MKYLKWIAIILVVCGIVYLIGPKPETPILEASPIAFKQQDSLYKLEQIINEQERKVTDIKPDNEARIIWVDSLKKQKTVYSIVYLHGFSASQGEGFPIHRNLAKRYGCNLYLSRLYAHGLKEKEPMLSITAEKLLQSAKEAIAVGKQLGDKVIILSTSTGGTLSLLLAGEDKDIAGLIMYAPNIDLQDPASFLLIKPWGLQIARLVMGGDYYSFKAPEAAEQYWTTKYRVEALIQLKELLSVSMNENNFKKINQPVFVGYYYKDEAHKDNVVSISRMKEMYAQLSTPEDKKRMITFPESGYHVIGSSYWNKDMRPVEDATYKFMEEIMMVKPVL